MLQKKPMATVTVGEGAEGAQAETALAVRLKALEEKLAKADGGPSEVEQAQAQVGRMLGRIAVIDQHVVISTLEVLVEAAAACHHKELGYYKKALQEVKRHEGEEGFCQLVAQLFGTSEDKRVISAVASWRKVVRAEEKPARPVAPKSQGAPVQAPPQAAHYPPPPMYPMGYMPPFMPPQHYAQVSPGARRARGAGHGSRRGARSGSGEGFRCFGCDEVGHRVSDCPAVKRYRNKDS